MSQESESEREEIEFQENQKVFYKQYCDRCIKCDGEKIYFWSHLCHWCKEIYQSDSEFESDSDSE